MRTKTTGNMTLTIGAALWLLAAGCAPGQAFAARVYATAGLNETQPYVQQNTVYTVRVYTDRTLNTADVTLPQVSGGIFTRLDDEWQARAVKGKHGTYVNERRFLFTPMRAGRIEIPPARVSVTTSGAGAGQQPAATQPWGQPYGGQYGQPWAQQSPVQPYAQQHPGAQPHGQPWGQQTGQHPPFGQQPVPQTYGPQAYNYPAYGQPQPMGSQGGGRSERLELETSPLTIEVTALVGQASGLLPLHNLHIDGNLQAAGEPRVGEPVTVMITVTGVGITGDRLPGVTDRLHSGDFKIYADRPHTEWAYDERLEAVVGRRIETVTMVPTRKGALELPIVEIPYWNVVSGRQEVARMATRPLRVQPAPAGAQSAVQKAKSRAAGEGRVPLRTESEDIWGFWLPVGGALLAAFIMGWRMGVVQRRQRRAREAPDTAPIPSPSPFAALAPAAAKARRTAAGLMPRPLTDRLSAGLSAVLRGVNRVIPRRVRVWTCMRCVQRAAEPQGICKILRRFATDCLGLPENSSLRSIGHAIARQRPAVETSAYVNLFGRLDDATYGSTSAKFDVAAWKRDFSKLFGRLLRAPRIRLGSAAGSGLPELNPR